MTRQEGSGGRWAKRDMAAHWCGFGFGFKIGHGDSGVPDRLSVFCLPRRTHEYVTALPNLVSPIYFY